jgi:hypothetical protein
MALYFVEYDLRKSKDYTALINELEKLKAVRYLKSAWCLEHNNTTVTVLRDYFKNFIDSDDGLMVAEVKTWASFNTESNPNKL